MEATATTQAAAPAKQKFTGYEIFIIAVLAFLQFTIILDFMVMAPLGDILMKELSIGASEFGYVVSAYAFTAGISGFFTAGFADKFDRKKLLMFFYVGFLGGTLLCGIANTYQFLLFARIVTGIFGGVVGSIAMAIVTDLFSIQQRGRVMGFIQMSFAGSMVLGLPIGLYLANHFDWHAPFLLIVGIAAVVGVIIMMKMKPVVGHLDAKTEKDPLTHLINTMKSKLYRRAFLTTSLLSIGGFLMMPFTTRFLTKTVLIDPKDLQWIYLVTGIASMIVMPLIGKLSDKIGKLRMFFVGSALAIVVVCVYVNLGPTPLWVIMVINALMFAAIMSRMIPSMALMSGIPKGHDRGAFMAINSCFQQIAGGIAAAIGGWIVVVQADETLRNFDMVGYLGCGIMVVCAGLMVTINKKVQAKTHVEQP